MIKEKPVLLPASRVSKSNQSKETITRELSVTLVSLFLQGKLSGESLLRSMVRWPQVWGVDHKGGTS